MMALLGWIYVDNNKYHGDTRLHDADADDEAYRHLSRLYMYTCLNVELNEIEWDGMGWNGMELAKRTHQKHEKNPLKLMRETKINKLEIYK